MQQAKMGYGSEPVLQKTKARGTWSGLFQCWAIEIQISFSCWQSEEHSPQPRLLQWWGCMKYLGLQNWRNATQATASLWKCAISNQRDCRYILWQLQMALKSTSQNSEWNGEMGKADEIKRMLKKRTKSNFLKSADFLVKCAVINKSMWKFPCPGSPIDAQASAGFSANVTCSLYELPLPNHVIVMSLV